jgi:regulator of replication initiation timing
MMAYPDEWDDVLKERDQLKVENERLREALEKIYRLYVQEEYHLTALKMAKVAQQALKEVKE